MKISVIAKRNKTEKNYRLLLVFKLLDPDPYIIYGSGSGYRRANNIWIQLDPDPQHWLNTFKFYKKLLKV